MNQSDLNQPETQVTDYELRIANYEFGFFKVVGDDSSDLGRQSIRNSQFAMGGTGGGGLNLTHRR